MNALFLTKKFVPLTLRHSSTGSANVTTFSRAAKCFRKVVLPLPMFPSTKTVKGWVCVEPPDMLLKLATDKTILLNCRNYIQYAPTNAHISIRP